MTSDEAFRHNAATAFDWQKTTYPSGIGNCGTLLNEEIGPKLFGGVCHKVALLSVPSDNVCYQMALLSVLFSIIFHKVSLYPFVQCWFAGVTAVNQYILAVFVTRWHCSNLVHNVLKNIYLILRKPTIPGECWTGIAWDYNILRLKVSDSSVQSFLKWLKWYKIPSQMGLICIHSGCTISRIWAKVHTSLTKTSDIFHNCCLTLTSLWFPAVCKCMQLSKCWESSKGWSRFMNLIFIYFTRRGGASYWRGGS